MPTAHAALGAVTERGARGTEVWEAPLRTLLTAIFLAAALWTEAFAQTADREALLERLATVLPESEAPLDSSPRYVTLRAELLRDNPGRAADIDSVFARMGTCLQTESHALTIRFLLEAVDHHLTDAEISGLVTFYEGPDYPRLAAFVDSSRSSPDLTSAEERAWAEQQLRARPELVKLSQLVVHTGRISGSPSRAAAVIRQCGDAAIDELRAAGLSN